MENVVREKQSIEDVHRFIYILKTNTAKSLLWILSITKRSIAVLRNSFFKTCDLANADIMRHTCALFNKIQAIFLERTNEKSNYSQSINSYFSVSKKNTVCRIEIKGKIVKNFTSPKLSPFPWREKRYKETINKKNYSNLNKSDNFLFKTPRYAAYLNSKETKLLKCWHYESC